MKLLLIAAGIFGFVLCQVHAFSGRGYRSSQQEPVFYSSGSGLHRSKALDAIISKVQNFAADVHASYDNLKDVLDNNGLSAVSQLADNVTGSLDEFIAKITKSSKDNSRASPFRPFELDD